MALSSTGVEGTVNMARYDSSDVISDDGVWAGIRNWAECDAIVSSIVNPTVRVSPVVAYPEFGLVLSSVRGVCNLII